MEDEETITKAISWFQTNENYHPLTCGNNSKHLLGYSWKNGKIILKCPHCNYEQDWIPDIVMEMYLKYIAKKDAPSPKGSSVATECPKCGGSLIDMDWDLLKVDGGALLCPNCNYAFTEPPNLQNEEVGNVSKGG